jgi:hypothetical protein
MVHTYDKKRGLFLIFSSLIHPNSQNNKTRPTQRLEKKSKKTNLQFFFPKNIFLTKKQTKFINIIYSGDH